MLEDKYKNNYIHQVVRQIIRDSLILKHITTDENATIPTQLNIKKSTVRSPILKEVIFDENTTIEEYLFLYKMDIYLRGINFIYQKINIQDDNEFAIIKNIPLIAFFSTKEREMLNSFIKKAFVFCTNAEEEIFINGVKAFSVISDKLNNLFIAFFQYLEQYGISPDIESSMMVFQSNKKNRKKVIKAIAEFKVVYEKNIKAITEFSSYFYMNDIFDAFIDKNNFIKELTDTKDIQESDLFIKINKFLKGEANSKNLNNRKLLATYNHNFLISYYSYAEKNISSKTLKGDLAFTPLDNNLSIISLSSILYFLGNIEHYSIARDIAKKECENMQDIDITIFTNTKELYAKQLAFLNTANDKKIDEKIQTNINLIKDISQVDIDIFTKLNDEEKAIEFFKESNERKSILILIDALKSQLREYTFLVKSEAKNNIVKILQKEEKKSSSMSLLTKENKHFSLLIGIYALKKAMSKFANLCPIEEPRFGFYNMIISNELKDMSKDILEYSLIQYNKSQEIYFKTPILKPKQKKQEVQKDEEAQDTQEDTQEEANKQDKDEATQNEDSKSEDDKISNDNNSTDDFDEYFADNDGEDTDDDNGDEEDDSSDKLLEKISQERQV